MRLLLVGTALAVLLTACGTATGETGQDAGSRDDAGARGDASETPRTSAQEDEPPPAAIYDFTGKTVDGDRFRGASLRGTPSVLWFWAPWCPTCRAQQGVMTELADTYDGRVAFVGVGGLDQDTGAIADFADQTSRAITHLSDPSGGVWRHFGITAQSTYVVLDGRGAVVEQGVLEDAEITDAVEALAG